MKFILGSIPNGAGTMVLWFCVVSYLHALSLRGLDNRVQGS